MLKLALGQGRGEWPLEVLSSLVFYDSAKLQLQWLLSVQIAGDKLLSATCVCFIAVFITLVDAFLQEKCYRRIHASLQHCATAYEG